MHRDGESLAVEVLEPRANLLSSSPSLLIMLAASRRGTLHKTPYSLAPQMFLRHGHRVLSLDLPGHGERIDEFGEGITGLCNAYMAGHDPFQRLVDDVGATLDRCQEMGMVHPGQVVVAGTSRGGYMALRVLAAEGRVSAAAGFAPVTDWRALSEFSADHERPEVAALALANYADAMAGKPVFLAIGHQDQRVDTATCQRLYLGLTDAREERGVVDVGDVEYHCTQDEGHSLGDEWYHRGAEFLLQRSVTGSRRKG